MPSSNTEGKKDREREIKEREDPGVWESEMQRSKRRGRSANGLWSGLNRAPSVVEFPCTQSQILVKLWLKF